MVERIQELYREYAAEFQRQEEKRRVGAGMFGLADGPRNYPCHERFARDLESLLKEAEKTAAPEQAEEILACVYFAPQARAERQDAVYWLLTAVHGMTVGLVSRLTPDAAGRLLARYQAAYPRREQLPAQRKAASALKKRGT